MTTRLNRVEKLIGKDKLALLQEKKVMVIGLGGVGSYVVEALVRSGLTSLTVIDHDTIEESNLNRQLYALSSTLGEKKVVACQKRCLDINSQLQINTYDCFLTAENLSAFSLTDYDFIIDACDTLTTKKQLIKECLTKNIPLISSMGTARKLDPSQLEIIDIRKTYNDPIARKLRKFMKDEQLNQKLPVLSSKELPISCQEETLGSMIFVPASAGLLIASYVVGELIKEKNVRKS